MRRSVLALILFVSACAPRTETPPPQSAPSAPAPRTSQLIGLTQPQLTSLLGAPALQIREGTSLKLQFRAPSCVLDAYLYDAGGWNKV